MTDTPELPNGWEWSGGERGESYYTINFGTEYRMGGDLAGFHGNGAYDGQIWHDEGGQHVVEILPILAYDEHGDPIFKRTIGSWTFDSEQEAKEGLVEIIEKLKEEA